MTDWNKKHKDNPSTIDYSGEDVSKGLLDLDNGEFDYLIFDQISVKTIIKQKNLDVDVTSIKSKDNPNNYIIFSDDQKDLQKSFNKALEKHQKSGKLEKISRIY